VIAPELPDEASDRGSPTLRHQPRYSEFEPASPEDEGARDAVERHIERHFGPISWVYHEIGSHVVHIDVHVVEPSSQRPYYTLVTNGMSDRPMSLPDKAIEAGHHEFAELMLCLPPEWPLGDEPYVGQDTHWPLRLLKQFARLPHEYQTWVGPWHSMPNGDPAEPYVPGLPFVAAMLTPMLRCSPEARTVITDDGRTISLLAVIPLHQAELDLKLAEGTDALLNTFDSVRVTELLDPDRPSSV
jgi:hypothetical protein